MKATSGAGVNVILEMLANVNLGADLKLLAQMGRVVVIGSRGDVTLTPRDLMSRRGAIHAFTLWAFTEAESKDVHAGINAGLENGTLRPVVGAEIPLKDAAQAHLEIMKPSGAFGKIVLIH
jgi:NADPH2:quinone reductase